jgi:hypothetical protein
MTGGGVRITINSSVDRPEALSTYEFPNFSTFFSALEAAAGPGSKEDSDLLVPVAEWSMLHRSVANIAKMSSLFVGDVDSKTDEELDSIIAALEGSSFGVYTTHSHRSPRKKELNCYRILIELDREYAPEDHSRLWVAVNVRLLGLLDPGARTPEQGYYLPSSSSEGQHLSEVWLQAGEPWCVDQLLVEAPTQAPQQNPSLAVVPGPSLQVLTVNLTGWVRHQTDLERKAAAKAAKALLSGRNEIEIGKGQRNDFLIRLAGYLAHTWPQSSAKTITDHFVGVGWDLFNADGKYPLSTFRSMVERMQDSEHANLAAAAQKRSEEQREAISRATGGQRDHLITDEEISAIQEIFGDNWQEHFLGSYKRDLYFLRADGTYDPNPAMQHQLFIAARDRLAVFGDLVEYHYEDARGAQRRKSEKRFLEEYAKVVRNVIYDMTRPEGGYDRRTETISLPAAQPVVEAVDHDDIQEWLELHDDHLIDMLSQMPHHDKMLPALVFTGERNAGKTLLAMGVGQMYGSDPLDGDVAFSNFNATAQTRQPIVFMDEKTAKAYKTEGTTLLRKFLTCSSRLLDEKYQARVELRGFLRMIIAANNLDVLNTEEEMGATDREAFSERLVHINMDLGKEFLEKQKGISENWLKRRHLAEHVRYLSENWEIRNPGRRFAVASNHTRLHDGLASSAGFAGDVAYWLLSYVQEKERGIPDNGSDGLLVSFRDGMLRVNSKTIVEKWDRYLKKQRVPTPSQISRALKSLSNKSRQKITYVHAGKQCRVDAYEIDPLQLRTANETHLLLEDFDATFKLH